MHPWQFAITKKKKQAKLKRKFGVAYHFFGCSTSTSRFANRLPLCQFVMRNKQKDTLRLNTGRIRKPHFSYCPQAE